LTASRNSPSPCPGFNGNDATKWLKRWIGALGISLTIELQVSQPVKVPCEPQRQFGPHHLDYLFQRALYFSFRTDTPSLVSLHSPATSHRVHRSSRRVAKRPIVSRFRPCCCRGYRVQASRATPLLDCFNGATNDGNLFFSFLWRAFPWFNNISCNDWLLFEEAVVFAGFRNCISPLLM